MSSSLIQVALTSIDAAQVGLTTTGHNISNASTAGYNRQSVVQAASEPSFSGAGYVGGGVDVRLVQRSCSGFLVAQTT